METASPPKAKLFLHGRSQAVRLPKEFRFEGTEVYVRRQGDEVVLSTRPKASMQSLVDALHGFEPGFQMAREQAAQADARTPLLMMPVPVSAPVSVPEPMPTLPARRKRAR